MIYLGEVHMVRKNNAKKEEIKVDIRKVLCMGLEYPYDHPKIYLEIPENKSHIDCPYCGKLFKLTSSGGK
jgi:uncharacterized Zn-finger protein